MIFLPWEKSVSIEKKETVLEVALSGAIPIAHSCGGMGSCGTCRIEVVEGLKKLGSRNPIEQEMADMRNFSAQERLACQIRPCEGLCVIVPPIEL